MPKPKITYLTVRWFDGCAMYQLRLLEQPVDPNTVLISNTETGIGWEIPLKKWTKIKKSGWVFKGTFEDHPPKYIHQ